MGSFSSRPVWIADIFITHTGAVEVAVGVAVTIRGLPIQLVLRQALPVPGWASLVAPIVYAVALQPLLEHLLPSRYSRPTDELRWTSGHSWDAAAAAA